MNPQSIKRLGLGIGILVLQVVFIRHLKIFGIQADLILLFILWMMANSTHTATILMAAFLGFSQDALLDLWGLNMFSKTLLAFIAYPWVSKNMDMRRQLPRILFVVFITALGHNLILVLLSFFAQHFTAELLFWRHWIGAAIYTTILAAIIQLFRSG